MLQLGFDSPLPSVCNIVFWALFAVTWIDFVWVQVSSDVYDLTLLTVTVR